MSEYPSDNICLSGRTTDPLYEATCYQTNPTLANVTTLWWVGYKIIFGANSAIEAIKDGADKQSDYIKGENYFLRAICHLNLVTLYAKPYSLGRSNPGIVLRNSTDNSITKRATVGEVYDQIVSDLIEAIRLMGNGGTARGNAGYASKAAAQGLLSRVYLCLIVWFGIIGSVLWVSSVILAIALVFWFPRLRLRLVVGLLVLSVIILVCLPLVKLALVKKLVIQRYLCVRII